MKTLGKITLSVVCVGALSACTQPMPVVSPQSPYQTYPYISKQMMHQKEYVSALMEAQMEESLKQSSSLVQADPSPVHEVVAPKAKRSYGKKSDDISALWGKPPAAVGDGITLMNPETRKRLNDALSTTPVDGEAKFRYGSRQFIFMPNSKVYQPYRTGGRCRDGIVIHYDEQGEEQLRGLFCQQGRGADWLLLK